MLNLFSVLNNIYDIYDISNHITGYLYIKTKKAKKKFNLS